MIAQKQAIINEFGEEKSNIIFNFYDTKIYVSLHLNL